MEFLRVQRSKSFLKWYGSLSEKERRQVENRIVAYLDFGIFPKSKCLSKAFSLYELKWITGMRVYFSYLIDSEGHFVLLLLGGNKNSQDFDISESKRIIQKVIESIRVKQRKKD